MTGLSDNYLLYSSSLTRFQTIVIARSGLPKRQTMVAGGWLAASSKAKEELRYYILQALQGPVPAWRVLTRATIDMTLFVDFVF